MGVLCVHSIGIVNWNPVLKKMFGYGGIGVYMFVFLSAVGLYSSVKWGGYNSKAEFYKRRIRRLIIPYCFIAITWYGLLDLVVGRNPVLFFYDISTLSFWLEHKGAWYVAMLIPVYLVFPFFHEWAEKKDSRDLECLLLLIILGFLCNIITPSVYDHLAQVISSIIVYLIGYHYASLDNKSNKNIIILSCICLIFFSIKTVTPLKNIEFVSNLSTHLLGIPMVFISAWSINAVKLGMLNCILGFFGKYSLEMYLCNIFIIQALTLFHGLEFFESHGYEQGYVAYVAVFISGSILAFFYGKISALFFEKFCKR